MTDFRENIHSLKSLYSIHESSLEVPDECPVLEPAVNGLDIRCGPILRLISSYENMKNYRASIMVITCDETTTVEPTITYVKGSVNDDNGNLTNGEFPKCIFERDQGFTFWRFYVNFKLSETEEKVRYTINGKISHEFFIPRINRSMNVISFSCNGFSLSTDTSSFKSSLWYDVMRKHLENKNKYHVMIGGGDQIYCDAIVNKSQEFKDWMNEKNKIKKRLAKSNEAIVKSFNEFYLHHYLAWFGQGHWVGSNGKTLQKLFPIAMASIPSINIYDDHDIIDGFGSYRDSTMNNEIFKDLGNTAYKYYMLFQQQVSINKEDNDDYINDKSWILSEKEGPFMKQKSHSIFTKLGPSIAFLGLDCRTERKLKQVVAPDTYNIVFKRLEQEIKLAEESNKPIKHLVVLLGVPIAYPRLIWLEWLFNARLLHPVKMLAERGIIFKKTLLNSFDGQIELLDDLEDHWCAKHHKHERNAFVGRLQDLGSKNGIRISILSGDVHLAAIGRFKSKIHRHHLTDQEERNDKIRNEPENDPRLMFNLISSAIVNVPPPDAMAGLLNKRSGTHHFDHYTDEDMVPIFDTDVNGKSRDNKSFLNRRNWMDLIPVQNTNYEIDTLKLPGPVEPQNSAIDDKRVTDKNRDLYYRVTEDSLVATLHVEKDHTDLQSETKDYELIIPELKGKHNLQNIGIK